MLVQVLLGLDVCVDSLADDGVGHIEGSATGGVEVDGLAGGFLGALLRGRGVVSIAGDAPAGVVIGVGAVLGGVRDVLEACDGVREAGRGIQLLRFSRGKMQFAGTRKSHDAARAGSIRRSRAPKASRGTGIRKMSGAFEESRRVHTRHEGSSGTRDELQKSHVRIYDDQRIWRITHPSRRPSGLGLRNPC